MKMAVPIENTKKLAFMYILHNLWAVITILYFLRSISLTITVNIMNKTCTNIYVIETSKSHPCSTLIHFVIYKLLL